MTPPIQVGVYNTPFYANVPATHANTFAIGFVFGAFATLSVVLIVISEMERRNALIRNQNWIRIN